MIINRNRLVIIFFLFCSIAFGQKKFIALHYSGVFIDTPLELEKNYTIENYTHSLRFTVFKFYVTHFEFYRNNQKQFTSPTSYFLIDFSDENSLNRSIEVPENLEYDEVRFYLGIDDITNNEGIGEGDLDPEKGMYWTWNTGFINLKLEGISNKSVTTDKSFQFHLGGFLSPYQAFTTVVLKDVKTQGNLTIFVDLHSFIKTIDLKNSKSIMSPSTRAVELSQSASKMFRL